MRQHNIHGYIHGYPYPRQAWIRLRSAISTNYSVPCNLQKRNLTSNSYGTVCCHCCLQ